jgi:AcrR family transcriptional regulator
MSVSSTPEPPVIRRPRTERTRRRLLDAGRTLFARHGPAGVTSHEIAAEAGFAAGTFYLHFKHKGELFQELTDQAASELELRLVAAATEGPDPRAIVEAQAEALVGFADEHRELFRIVFTPGSEGAEAAARVLERLARGVSARRRAAAARGQAWECLDPDVLAQAIVGMWVRVLSWWVDEPSRATRAEIVRTLSHFQLHGNRPANERLDCAASNRRTARTLVLAPPLVRSSDSDSDSDSVARSARSKTVPSPASPKPSASDRRKGRSRKPRGVPSP